MKNILIIGILGIFCLVFLPSLFAQPALTVYNQDFAVVRDLIALDLKKGVNSVKYTGMTAHLEPDSVILRDLSGKRNLQILEQNYLADPVSQEFLLSLYEGKTIDFVVQRGERTEIVQGKIIRSGYVPHQSGMRRYGSQYYATQMAYSAGSYGQPIIEMEGKLRFSLPGIPLFPALSDDTVLKPTINWIIDTDKEGKTDVELCYITGGMSWEADYNVVSPEKGDVIDIIGWVTIDNQSGKAFDNAKIKLMAGEVSKIQPQLMYAMESRADGGFGGMQPPVSEKSFDEYHLYTLERPTTLLDRETKQVEFVRAQGVKSERLYIYDGAKIDYNRYRGDWENILQDRNYGTMSNSKVWVMREFKNSKENHLGIPLPKGRLRFYRQDNDGQLEFTGENIINHTPNNETIRVYTGNAFDIVGERKRTNYKINTDDHWLDESFEIKLRNHKKEEVEVSIVEHLYRCDNWEIREKSSDYLKQDSHTIEFKIKIPPEEEKVATYLAHYTW